MYKFIFIRDDDLQKEITSFVVAVLRDRFGFSIPQNDFDQLLDYCLEQIDEVFDIDY